MNNALSKSAASETGSRAFEAHIFAQQAFVLIDLNKSSDAVDLLDQARALGASSSPPVLQAWLAAAHGEALAANSQHVKALLAFDDASRLLPPDTSMADAPYVALDNVHLDRWRGHGLSRVGAKEAIPVLSSTLEILDPSFTRAETALRVDLTLALATANRHEEAHQQAAIAAQLAIEIGSMRQKSRIQTLSSHTP